jgi:hypothetical protein
MARATKNSISGGPLRREQQMTGLRRDSNQASLGVTLRKGSVPAVSRALEGSLLTGPR